MKLSQVRATLLGMHIEWSEQVTDSGVAEQLAQPEIGVRLRATAQCWSVVVGAQVRSGTVRSIEEARSRAHAEYLSLAATR